MLSPLTVDTEWREDRVLRGFLWFRKYCISKRSKILSKPGPLATHRRHRVARARGRSTLCSRHSRGAGRLKQQGRANKESSTSKPNIFHNSTSTPSGERWVFPKNSLIAWCWFEVSRHSPSTPSGERTGFERIFDCVPKIPL